MDHLFEIYRPELRRPVLVTAFAGWNDAAEVATGGLRFLARQWGAEPCAEVDPEDFFVFTETRPQVRIVDKGQRRITWPQNQFFHARPPGAERDVLFLIGAEPHLKWKTFCGLVLDYSVACGVDLVISVGGLLADVLHSRAPVLTGSVAEPDLARRVSRLGLHRSRYEGPTGIVGVLGSLSRDRGIANGSVWGNVPHYIASLSNPPVMSALVRCVSDLLAVTVDVSELDRASVRFNAQVARAIADDADVASYVRQLEDRDSTHPSDPEGAGESSSTASELPNADLLVQDLEEFFRKRGQPPQS